MSNYTVEDFEKWLNTDKSRQAGLKGWRWILKQIKSDADLRVSLIYGNDQESWNFSDPKWRKKWKWFGESLDDYYQVFLNYKEEVDSRVSEEEEQNSNSSTPSSENNNDKPETEEQQKNDNPLTISEKIIALLEMSADYKQGQEKFFDRVIELLDLMRSAVVPSQKIKSLEDFLYKHEEQKQELQPLTELVKKWKEEEKMIEESTEIPFSDVKNNWSWGKIGLGVIVVLLVGIIWWGWKKMISFF